MIKKLFLIVATVGVLFGCGTSKKTIQQPEETLKVMTWNIWGKLNLAPKYTIGGKTARQRVIDIIQESKADIICMVETYGSAAEIAEQLGFHYYTPNPKTNLCIFSRYPLEDVGKIKGLSGFSFIRATAVLPSGQKIKVYDIWLTSGGRHIVEVKNKKLNDVDFVKGDNNRYKMMQKFLSNPIVQKDIKNKDAIPMIVAGDYNCVSGLDYTETSKELNYGRVLTTPTHKAIIEVGFVDSFRAVHPIISKETLGYTWTTVGQGYEYKKGEGFIPVKVQSTPEHRDPYARIDYIYASARLKPIKSTTIVHHSSNLKRSFPEFPSDHAAVLTTFKIQ